MNLTTHIAGLKKSLFFLLGIVVAVFVVAQEVIDYHCEQVNTDMETNEQSDENDDAQSQSVLNEYTCELALPSATIQLGGYIPVFICEVIRESEEEDRDYPMISLYDSPYYKNLFRQIISPNAP